MLQVPGDEVSMLVTLGRAEELRNMELVGHGGDRSSGLAGTAANGREQRGEHGGKKQELTARPAVVSAGSGTTGKRRIVRPAAAKAEDGDGDGGDAAGLPGSSSSS